MRKVALFYSGVCNIVLLLFSCNADHTKSPGVASIDLKRGDIISCGPRDGEIFGKVSFAASVPDDLKKDFNTGIALLYSFEYDESEKMFAKVIDQAPDCAMAYWGVAMSNFHQLWAPPSEAELKKGMEAIRIARQIKNKTRRESDYIEAVASFFENAGESDHRTRLLKFEEAMRSVYDKYQDDTEAKVFYALSLSAASDPADKKYVKQKKALELLNPIFQKEPLHPGIAHYIIHNADYPELAEMALPAARKYALIAPASAHARHMPSHIFTRLGYWDECIQSNLAAAAAAQCYAEQAKLKGHWDEELHCLDYLVYGYLQKGDELNARKTLEYLQSINEVSPVTFKVSYAFAAMPARYALERKDWKQAAALQLQSANVPWEKFPWQKAIFHFAKAMGYVHTNNLDAAKKELATLQTLHAMLAGEKNKALEAAQVDVQIRTAGAWIQYKSGDHAAALQLMRSAADMEDATEKHPVTPGAVIPARELLGEMLMEMDQPALALEAFDVDLKIHPNRLNGMRGRTAALKKLGKDTGGRSVAQLN